MSKRILMCPPDHFDIEYSINAWMDTANRVDRDQAAAQWGALKAAYEKLGYEVEEIQPQPGLPDMVFTANGGLLIGGKVSLPRFSNKERQPETEYFRRWFEANGFTDIYMPKHVQEGEGDALFGAGKLFAGYGFRSDIKSHAELAGFFGIEVVSLKLVDPRFYHLDTAMAILDDQTLMYYPGAFSEDSRQKLAGSFERLIEAPEADAAAFGLNAVSDGRNVFLSSQAEGLIKRLKELGYEPIGLPVTEFRKSGGGIKCLTLELRG